MTNHLIVKAKKNIASIRCASAELKTLLSLLDDKKAAELEPMIKEMMATRFDNLSKLVQEQEALLVKIDHSLAVTDLVINLAKPADAEPIEVLELPEAIVMMLKREANLYTIHDLLFFMKRDPLTAIRGCGITKSYKIELALDRYIKKKNTSTVDAEALGW